MKRYRYYRFNEFLVLSLGSLFSKILAKLQYQQKYLPIRDEITSFLMYNLRISRKKNNILVHSAKKDNQKYILRLFTSDRAVFNQVFIENEYVPIIKLIEEKSTFNSIKIIIDAGSNIGMTSIFFASIFPSALTISIEPEESNYLQQLQNINLNKLNDKVIVLQKALWINNTDNLKVCSDFRDGGNWSKTIEISNEETINLIQSISLKDLIDKYTLNKTIDLLKMDIEGTEKVLFESDEFIKTISKCVRFLCLEIHDEFNIRDTIRNVFRENKFEFFDVGETTFCFNKNLIKSKNEMQVVY